MPPPVKLIQSNLSDVSPRISPDGRRVAFDSSRSGAGHVWVCDRFGRNPVQVTSWEEESGSARWSPQGDELALDSAVDGNADVFVVRDDGSWLRRLTEDPATDCVPSWSQDGKWIYFASNRSGRFEIWKVGTNGETAVQQTRHGGFAGVESTDGRYLYYARDDQRPTKLLRMPVAGGEEEVVLEDLRRWPYFALLHNGVCYVPDAAPAPRFEVLFADPLGKNVRSLVTIPKSLGFGFSVAPDRTWILFAHSEFRGSDLVLVDNFR